jgi:hypothetical protein
MGSFTIVFKHRYHYSDQVKENEVGEACGRRGNEEISVQISGGKTRRKEAT